nr:MAG TPA: hypothetical protein [Caudoviricetes sp.]
MHQRRCGGWISLSSTRVSTKAHSPFSDPPHFSTVIVKIVCH